MLVANPRGNYSFVRGISPYSGGAVASPGFAIEHARFLRPLPLEKGFDAVEAHLKRVNRPKQALCAMELRSPKPFTFTGFNQFNAGYVEVLKEWDILQDGAGELPEGSLDPHDVVRRGETSPAALIEKARFVMGLMEGRINGLGVTWADSTVTEIYTVFDIHGFLQKEILERMGKGAAHGVVWHYSRPPIESIEFEMDLRGCRHEVVL
jgi:hypothetical protein